MVSQAYSNGLRRCIGSVPLWRSSAYLEEKAGAVGKARAVLEQARLKNPKQDQLWLAAIRTELRSGNNKAADGLMAKALQVSPYSGSFTSSSDVRQHACSSHEMQFLHITAS